MKHEMTVFYIPCKNKKEAEDISRALLDANLIACANILPGILSMYSWNSKIEMTQETLLLIKTTNTK